MDKQEIFDRVVPEIIRERNPVAPAVELANAGLYPDDEPLPYHCEYRVGIVGSPLWRLVTNFRAYQSDQQRKASVTLGAYVYDRPITDSNVQAILASGGVDFSDPTMYVFLRDMQRVFCDNQAKDRQVAYYKLATEYALETTSLE